MEIFFPIGKLKIANPSESGKLMKNVAEAFLNPETANAGGVVWWISNWQVDGAMEGSSL